MSDCDKVKHNKQRSNKWVQALSKRKTVWFIFTSYFSFSFLSSLSIFL